jgi:hypothetical protein
MSFQGQQCFLSGVHLRGLFGVHLRGLSGVYLRYLSNVPSGRHDPLRHPDVGLSDAVRIRDHPHNPIPHLLVELEGMPAWIADGCDLAEQVIVQVGSAERGFVELIIRSQIDRQGTPLCHCLLKRMDQPCSTC